MIFFSAILFAENFCVRCKVQWLLADSVLGLLEEADVGFQLRVFGRGEGPVEEAFADIVDSLL